MKNLIGLTFIYMWTLCFPVWGTDKIQLFTEHIPPFQIVDQQGVVTGGVAHVVVEELMRRLKLEANFIPLPWARAYKLTLHSPNSFIYSIARSKQREKQFIWIGKIKQVRYFFYGSPEVKRQHIVLGNILNMNVAVVRGSIESDLLQQVGFEKNKNLILTDSYPAAFQMALLGRVDAVYANQFATMGMTKFLGDEVKNLRPLRTLDHSLNLYLAANVDSDPKLIKLFKNEFSKMVAENKIQQLILAEEKRLFETSI